MTAKEQGLHDISFSVEMANSEDEVRRSMVYGNESFKETEDELNQTTMEENN